MPDISQAVFEGIVDEYLLPFYPGAVRIEAERVSNRGHELASTAPRPDTMRVYPHRNADYRILIRRSQYFEYQDVSTARVFISVLSDIYDRTRIDDIEDAVARDALSAGVRRCVARTVSGDDDAVENIAIAVIDCLSSWAEQTYEGGRISAAIGVGPQQSPGSVSFSRLLADDCEDVLKVLSNGYDTLLSLSPSGAVTRLVPLPEEKSPSSRPPQNRREPDSPYRYLDIATWSLTKGRAAFVLNRNGEILVFCQGVLRFAKRRGEWHHFSREPATKVMCSQAHIGHTLLRAAVYDSALDVSFARTGGVSP